MFKKTLSLFFILSALGMNTFPVFAGCTQSTEQHLDVHKKAPNNIVIVAEQSKTVKCGNVLQFAFDEKYLSKCSQAGDIIHFVLPQALYTREGTMILPCGSKVTAEVINVEKPKWFNKNARVSLIFRNIVLPDGACIDIRAYPFTKDGKLKEGPWTTTGKLVLSTLTCGILGAGAGVGLAFIPNPAKLGAGFAIGIPVGCGVGLAAGLITPGCHYKAKAGEAVYAVLLEDFCVSGK